MVAGRGQESMRMSSLLLGLCGGEVWNGERRLGLEQGVALRLFIPVFHTAGSAAEAHTE